MVPTLVLLLALHLPQNPDPARAAGRVVDADGAPVARAEVTWLARPIARCAESGEVHRATATTDDAGRFRIELRSDCTYSAWALWPGGASAVAEGAAAGEFLELRGSPRARPMTVTVTGLEAWSEAATFTLRACVGSEHIDFVAASRGAHDWTIPALPPVDQRGLELLDARGEVLWCETAPTDRDRVELALPAPQERRVEVVDADGAPLADVALRVHRRNYWYSESDALPYGERFRALWPIAARTDARGAATLRFATTQGPDTTWVMAEKPGFRMVLGGHHEGRRIRDGRAEPAAGEADPAPLRLALAATAPQTMALRRSSGEPLAAGFAFAAARVFVKLENGGGIGMPFHVLARVEDGAASFVSPLPDGAKVEFASVQLVPTLRRELAGAHGFGPPPEYVLPVRDDLLTKQLPTLLPEATLRPLHVVAGDGRPAARCVVVATGSTQAIWRHRTDRLGRALVDASEGTRYFVLGPQGFGHLVAPPPATRLDLSLRSLVDAKVRVVDPDGAPVAGVEVRLQQLLGIDDATLGLPTQAVAELAAIARLAAITGADGTCRLPMPPFAAQVRLGVDGRLRIHSESRTAWDPAQPQLELVVAPR